MPGINKINVACNWQVGKICWNEPGESKVVFRHVRFDTGIELSIKYRVLILAAVQLGQSLKFENQAVQTECGSQG
jgi:hypothetical protein